MTYLLYHDIILGEIPDSTKTVQQAFSHLGYDISSERSRKMAYIKRIPGFTSFDGYPVDLSGMHIVRTVTV